MNTLFYFLIIPLCLNLLDILTGLCKAFKNKEVSSTKLRQGLWHKMGFVLLLCLSWFLTWSQSYINLGFEVPLLQPTSIYICVTEVISILENIAKISPELCGFIDKYLKDKNTNENEQEK